MMNAGDLAYVYFGTSFLLSAAFDRSTFGPAELHGKMCVVLKRCPKLEFETSKENYYVVLVHGERQIILQKYLKSIGCH